MDAMSLQAEIASYQANPHIEHRNILIEEASEIYPPAMHSMTVKSSILKDNKIKHPAPFNKSALYLS